jgi:hypothetical protein
MKQGENTGNFGEEITRKYKNKYKIFFDHGNKNTNDNVVRCKGFYGKEVKNNNRLTNIDLIIADSNGVIRVLIEIEERYCSPKKIIGDIFSIAMCNKIAIKKELQEYFQITKETILIIGGIVPTTGVRKIKIDNIINERIKIFEQKNDGLDLKKVELCFEENIENVFEQIKQRLNDALM